METQDKRVELEESLSRKLLLLNMNVEGLDPKDKEYLLSIERVVLENYAVAKELRESLKKNKLSLNVLAARTKIARQTFYSNDVLKVYVELTIKEFESVDLIAIEYRQKEEIRSLNDIIATMVVRDCAIEEQAIEIEQLKADLKQSEANVVELTKRLRGGKR